MGYFLIKEVPSGVKFDLLAANGEVIATSEVYNSLAACRKGIQSVATNAPKAKLEDQTEAHTPVTNPKFEIYQDKREAYRFRLRSRNGAIIAVSEGYSSKNSCLDGIDSVKNNAISAEIIKKSEKKD